MKPNPHEPESSQSLAIDEQYDSDGDTLHVSGEKDSENPFGCNESLGGESVTGVTEESFGESFYESETEEHRGISVYRDSETEKYFLRPEFDPNQDPGPSLQLEIPGEEILVTPDMLERAEAWCAEQEDADTIAVSAVLTYEKSWSEVTQRAIRIGRLSPLGLASLTMEYLDATNQMIDHQLLYWKHQQVKIEQARRDLAEAQAKVKRDNQLLAEIKGKTVDLAEKLAAEQQKDLLSSYTTAVPSLPKPTNRCPSTPIHRSKLDFKAGHLPRMGGFGTGRAIPTNLQALSMGTAGLMTPSRLTPMARSQFSATPGPSHSVHEQKAAPQPPTTVTSLIPGSSTPKTPSTATPGINPRDCMGL